MKNYPETATERFDKANFHIKYCLYSIRKFIKGNVLEVGAGCGSFTRNYYKTSLEKITLTETDDKNFNSLKNNFSHKDNIEVLDLPVYKIDEKFDSILYLHVLEHIKDDNKEIYEATKKLKSGGYLIIMAPAHQKIYSNLDKAVGHFRRYEEDFFKKKFDNLELVKLKFLDSMGYVLYFLNKLVFSKETFPSNFKIFLWDKIFTPITIFFDFLTNYKIGKCIVAIYKKN